MIALVHSELLKLRTLRSTAYAAAALLAIALLTASLGMGDAGEKGYSTPEQLRETILAVGYAAVFFLAVMGAIAAAGEYRHRTISQRFLVSPARHRVLLAKLAAYALVGIGTAVVITAVSAALGEAVVSSRATRSTSATPACG
jgi:ABC-2 type transport system permease protein